jgi:hypothetical protein
LDNWWIEGTARFMDGELYPIAPGSNVVKLGYFPEHYDPRFSVVEQPNKGYSTSLFFHYLLMTGRTVANVNQWVAQKVGQTSVDKDLIDIAADRSPYLSFPKNWHGFAVAFADKKIKYHSSGELIQLAVSVPSTTLAQSLTVGQTKPLSRSVKAFTFNIVRYTFPANTANFLLPSGTALPFRCSFRLKGSTSWVPVGAGVWEYIQPATSGTSYIDTLCSCGSATDCSGTFSARRSA